MKKQIDRNLKPHQPALLAIALWGAEYSRQIGGCMDFYDGLSDARKKTCRHILARIAAAPPETEKA